MSKAIKHNLFFEQSPEDVWDYLTKPELIEQWLMKNTFQPKLGCQFQFFMSPMPDHNFDGNMYCTVVELVPFKKLTYTWKCGPGDGSINLDSVVSWTLHEKDNGTELQLVHDGFKVLEDYFMFTAMDAGWLANMKKIPTLINNAKNGTSESGRVSSNS